MYLGDNAMLGTNHTVAPKGARLFPCLLAGLAAILATGSQPVHATSAPLPDSLATLTLTEALAKPGCISTVPAHEPNPAVQALHIDSSSGCSEVAVHAADASSTAPATPLIPVVVGSGGRLTFHDEAMTLYASSFLIKNGGTMQAGTLSTPIKSQIEIAMAGNASASPAPLATGSTPIVSTTNAAPNVRDITVMDGGVLELHGRKGLSAPPDGTSNDPATNPRFIDTTRGTPSWTYLALPAGPTTYDDAENVSAPVPLTAPDKTLTLATTVDWRANDWVAVATTSFSSHQTEIVQICGITTIADPHPSSGPQSGTVLNASNTSPIVIGTQIVGDPSAPVTGAQVTISGVKGNTAANGTWTVTRTGPASFSLDGSSGNGASTTDGSWEAAKVSQLTLCGNSSLKHYHFGGPAPTPGYFPANTTQAVVAGGNPIDVSFEAKSFYDGSDRNYGIDERAEVALLSRNIKLTSLAGQVADATPFIGGHLVAMVSMHGQPSPTLRMSGVEIEKFGQALVGRYPVHLHHLPQFPVTAATNAQPIVVTSASAPTTGSKATISGVAGNTAANGTWAVTKITDTTFSLTGSTGNGAAFGSGTWTPDNVLIQDVSVHHSYNKCFVVHHTANAKLYDNVCVRTIGQGVYLEDGKDITGNQFIRNFVAGTMAADATYSYPPRNGSLYWDGDNLQASKLSEGDSDGASISAASNAAPIVVTVETADVPASGSLVTIAEVGGNTAANGTWTITKLSDTTFSLNGSYGHTNGRFESSPGAVWSIPGPSPTPVTISHATNASPIVVTTARAPDTGTRVAVAGVKGNTAANGTWTVKKLTDTTFSLDNSNGAVNDSYTTGGIWKARRAWYSVTGIADTSNSGANSSSTIPGPDSYHPGGFWITNTANTFVNNAVAGCQAQGRGYWLLGQDPTQIDGYPEFAGNRAHACYNGIDTAPDAINASTSNPAPLLPTPSYPVTGITGTKSSRPPIIVTSPTALPARITGGQDTVKITGVANGGDGTWTITEIDRPHKKFTITAASYTGSGATGGKWALESLPVGAATRSAGTDSIVITVPGHLPIPPIGGQVSITGSSNSAANVSGKVHSATTTTFTIKTPGHTSALAATGGNWQLSGDITSFVPGPPPATTPIVVTTSAPAPATGALVTVSGTTGNPAAKGTWTATNISPTKFSLDGSTGGGLDADSGGQWGPAAHAPVLVLNRNTVTRSRNRGFWGRSIFFALHDNRFATNPYGVSLAGGGGPEGNLPGYWDLAHQNVFAGMTRNNVERYPACPQSGTNWQQECTDVSLQATTASWGNYPSAAMNIQGYSYYDGPARIEHNRFVNFRFDPTGKYPNDPAARLLTTTDIQKIANYGTQGQLQGIVTAAEAGTGAAPSADYEGYAGDPATGWIQSNQQSVPPTQYMRDSIWDNVDFKHQVYDASVNMGVFEDGDKTTVILDKDGRLSGLKVVCAPGTIGCDTTGVVPVSLNNLEYYATDYTVDEPHSRGPNNFLATSLMSPHKYATLNVETVPSPANANTTTFRVNITRDMPSYGDSVFPSLFLNGRGQKQIYEPFVMDRMGYSVHGMLGTENKPQGQSLKEFPPRLLFSYTDPAVKTAGDYFVNRIAVYQPLAHPSKIKMYRIRRRWGDQYTGAAWPPAPFVPPIASPSCDGTFFSIDTVADQMVGWNDCIARGTNADSGTPLTAATSWEDFDKSYTKLLKGTKSVQDFINDQKYYYDSESHLLYFYMIEDQPVQKQYAPFGTCDAANYSTGSNYLGQIQAIKSFSDPNSVKAALDAACLVESGTPQPNDLFSCSQDGCAAYLVDLSTAGTENPTPLAITNVSTATPIVVTTAGAPPTGTQVVISGVTGNTAANGAWSVTNISDTTFSLDGSDGTGSAPGVTGATWFCSHCVPPRPISRTDYRKPYWNQYEFQYRTPAQQSNGLPVATDLAVGNSAPPTDGAPLAGLMTPRTGTKPPAGDRVSYDFLTLGGGQVDVTENFPYRCALMPPWSPVNARGDYPPSGGFTYPLHDSICAMPHVITRATNTEPIVITSNIAPPTGTQVTISGVLGNTNANDTWTVTNTGATTFSLDNSVGNGPYVAGNDGVWQMPLQ